MQTNDVSDLPEPYVRAVRAVVETFRRQLVIQGEEREPPARPPVELPRWRLGVVGGLTREEIYDDRGNSRRLVESPITPDLFVIPK